MKGFGLESSVSMRKLDWCGGSLYDWGGGESTPWVSMHIIIRRARRLRSSLIEQRIFRINERTAMGSGAPTRFISLGIFLGPPRNTEWVGAYNSPRRNIFRSSRVGSQNRSSVNYVASSRRDLPWFHLDGCTGYYIYHPNQQPSRSVSTYVRLGKRTRRLCPGITKFWIILIDNQVGWPWLGSQRRCQISKSQLQILFLLRLTPSRWV